MLKSLKVKNFTVFEDATLEIASGLNVFIGENGLGKSHLLKLPYSIMAVSAEEGKKPGSSEPSKAILQTRIAQKLVGVMRPEALGRLTRRSVGRIKTEVQMRFKEPALGVDFSFATQSKSEVSIERCPVKWLSKAPVFLPTRELLTIYPSFVSIYDAHYLEFEETWRDTCVLLGAPALKGARETRSRQLLKPLEEAMGDKVVLENGRFYLGHMEMPLVAEGLRKLAMLVRLIATGSLFEGGYLFWDEPETNLNPKLVKLIAKVILHLCSEGIQVFIATHSLFLLKELEILSMTKEFKNIDKRFFALSKTDGPVSIKQGQSIDKVGPLVMLDEELEQSGRYLSADTQENIK